MNIIEQMRLFLEPRSVAVIGATRRTGLRAQNVFENMVKLRFRGKLYPVNPNAAEILGYPAYPSIKDIPHSVDLAVIATPREMVIDLVRQCGEKGIKAVVIIAQGFADAGAEGRALQGELARAARESGVRIIGPNTFGVANAFLNLNTAFVLFKLVKRPVAVMSQTGFFFAGLPGYVLTGKGIDLGNSCDIDFADGLEYFEADPMVELIVLHIEGLQDGRRFMEVASRVARKKPIIALKTARTAQGTRMAQSHTGSLGGEDRVYDGMFRQCGIIRASDMDELADLVKGFMNLPLMKGPNLAVLAIPYGGAVITADACHHYGLKLAELSPHTLAELSQFGPPWLKVTNPVDFAFLAQHSGRDIVSVFRHMLSTILADGGVDGVLCIMASLGKQDSLEYSDVIAEAAEEHSDKPIVGWFYGPRYNLIVEEIERSGKTVVFSTGERAVRALAGLRQYAQMTGRGE